MLPGMSFFNLKVKSRKNPSILWLLNTNGIFLTDMEMLLMAFYISFMMAYWVSISFRFSWQKAFLIGFAIIILFAT